MMIEAEFMNACPFPPGEPKPEAMDVAPRPRTPLLRRLMSGRTLALALAFIALTALYVHSYQNMSLPDKSLMYQPDFAAALSMYTYASVMLTYFIRRYRNRARKNM